MAFFQQSNDSPPNFWDNILSGALSSAGTSALMMGIVAGVMKLGSLATIPGIAAPTVAFFGAAAVVVTAALIFGGIMAAKEAQKETEHAPLLVADTLGRGVMISPEISAATRSAVPHLIPLPLAAEQAPDFPLLPATESPSNAWQSRIVQAGREDRIQQILAQKSDTHTQALANETSKPVSMAV